MATDRQQPQHAALFWAAASYVRSSATLKLLACILVDVIGMISYALPVIGELGDAVWSPLAAWFINFMFGSWVFTLLGFVEEIGPGTDFIPTASIAWAVENIETCLWLRNVLGMRSSAQSWANQSPN